MPVYFFAIFTGVWGMSVSGWEYCIIIYGSNEEGVKNKMGERDGLGENFWMYRCCEERGCEDGIEK